MENTLQALVSLEFSPRSLPILQPITRSTYSMCVHACQVTSVVTDSATQWTVAHQASLSMGFSGQEYWSWLPCPPPGDLPDPGIKPGSPAMVGGFFTTSIMWEACTLCDLFTKLHDYDLHAAELQISISSPKLSPKCCICNANWLADISSC